MPQNDSFDAFLTWFAYRSCDVPMLPAVYSGYALFFGSTQSSQDSLDSYCALQGKAFLWGCQLGWNSTWLLRDNRREYLDFTVKLCRERLDNLEFLLEGELLCELPTPHEVPEVEIAWNREKSGNFKVPAVMGTLWRNGNGSRKRAFLVNVSDSEQLFAPCIGSGCNLAPVRISPRSVTHIDVVPDI